MKKGIFFLSVVFAIVLGCLVVGCHPKEPDGEVVGQQENPPEIDYSSPYEGDIDIVGAAPPGLDDDADRYNVNLDVKPEMKMNKEYVMSVTVILPQYDESEVPEGMTRGTKVIYANDVKSVRVTPIAPGFDVNPAESKIVDFDPSGTEFQFRIIPREKGPSTISAEVELFENADGTGGVKSKASGTVSVNVKVNIEGGLVELFGVVWEAFKKFWSVAVALVFAALLFVFRKYIKKKTGYGGGGDDAGSGKDEVSEEAEE